MRHIVQHHKARSFRIRAGKLDGDLRAGSRPVQTHLPETQRKDELVKPLYVGGEIAGGFGLSLIPVGIGRRSETLPIPAGIGRRTRSSPVPDGIGRQFGTLPIDVGVDRRFGTSPIPAGMGRRSGSSLVPVGPGRQYGQRVRGAVARRIGRDGVGDVPHNLDHRFHPRRGQWRRVQQYKRLACAGTAVVRLAAVGELQVGALGHSPSAPGLRRPVGSSWRLRAWMSFQLAGRSPSR